MSGKQEQVLSELVRRKERLKAKRAEIMADTIRPIDAEIRVLDKKMAVVVSEG